MISIAVMLIASGISCGGTNNNKAFSEKNMPIFNYADEQMAGALKALAESDRDTIAGDRGLKRYYAQGGEPLWLNSYGVRPAADTLVAVLSTVKNEGFGEKIFGADTLAASIKRIRKAAFAEGEDTLTLFAALEYGLTKSYLRYVTGQRFGFVNPRRMLNRINVDKTDKTTGKIKRFKVLFDIDIERPDSAYYANALSNVGVESIGGYMRSSRVESALYDKYCEMLGDTLADAAKRMSILCNMERCRWRGTLPKDGTEKYVVANIPAYYLYAHYGDSTLGMKIGCGTYKNKTPLLASKISWMEVNPEWIIPKSIIENEVSPHAGDTSYFNRNRYFIVDKQTGDTMRVDSLSARMLKSGKYKIAQRGGAGNSLGRIVFRFKNNLAIYLHDTSTRAFFRREKRSVSHGCVRIEKPFEFAEYLLDTDDEWKLDKLRISMDMKPESDEGKKFMKEHRESGESDDKLKLVKRMNVDNPVELYIIYNTIYPNEDGNMVTYPDVYGYDKLLSEYIKPLVD